MGVGRHLDREGDRVKQIHKEETREPGGAHRPPPVVPCALQAPGSLRRCQHLVGKEGKGPVLAAALGASRSRGPLP